MDSLKQRINADVKAAMRNKNKKHLVVLRLITAAIKQKEVDERIEIDDAQIISILNKMVKQLRDAIPQYEKAGRQDLVDKELFELEIVQEYLPEQLSKEEITRLVNVAIEETHATTMRDMGKVMGNLKAQLEGQADMAEVSNLVRQQLS